MRKHAPFFQPLYKKLKPDQTLIKLPVFAKEPGTTLYGIPTKKTPYPGCKAILKHLLAIHPHGLTTNQIMDYQKEYPAQLPSKAHVKNKVLKSLWRTTGDVKKTLHQPPKGSDTTESASNAATATAAATTTVAGENGSEDPSDKWIWTLAKEEDIPFYKTLDADILNELRVQKFRHEVRARQEVAENTLKAEQEKKDVVAHADRDAAARYVKMMQGRSV